MTVTSLLNRAVNLKATFDKYGEYGLKEGVLEKGQSKTQED